MRRFSSSWSNTLNKLGFQRKRKRTRARHRAFHRRSLLESLEPRHLLSLTVNTDDFAANSSGERDVAISNIDGQLLVTVNGQVALNTKALVGTSLVVNGSDATENVVVLGTPDDTVINTSDGNDKIDAHVSSAFQASRRASYSGEEKVPQYVINRLSFHEETDKLIGRILSKTITSARLANDRRHDPCTLLPNAQQLCKGRGTFFVW